MDNDRALKVMGCLGGAFLLALVWGLFQHHWCSQEEVANAKLKEQAASVSAELEKNKQALAEETHALELKDHSMVGVQAKNVILESRLATAEQIEKDLKGQLEKEREREKQEVAAKQAISADASALKEKQKATEDAQSKAQEAAEALRIKNAQTSADAQAAKKGSDAKASVSATDLQNTKSDLDAAQQALTLTKSLYNKILNEEHAKDAEIAHLKDTGGKVWNDLANANREKDSQAKEITSLQAQITTMQNELTRWRNGTQKK